MIGVGNIGSGHVQRVTGDDCSIITITAIADRRAFCDKAAADVAENRKAFVCPVREAGQGFDVFCKT